MKNYFLGLKLQVGIYTFGEREVRDRLNCKFKMCEICDSLLTFIYVKPLKPINGYVAEAQNITTVKKLQPF